jgi:T1SS-143 domain-containing protein
MANDSTNTGVTSSAEDTTPHSENFFTDMQGEDAFFGPEQLAQASTTEKVAVPQGQNVIRVQVNPGEIIELSSPFDAGATLLAREGDGNLAIRVGDVTVILQGYVDANQQAPVVIQTSDGQPIDIAVLLASTDPTIDIQTAAGPGDTGPQGQGADNTGAILAQLQGGNGLGGLNAVGTQDGTNLKYGLIDNSILLDREDALLLTGVTPFPGVQEPFLRDPFKTDDGSWTSFEDFLNEYTSYINDHKDDTDSQGNSTPGGWADFTGTKANSDDADAFLELTTYTVTVPHSSDTPERLEFWDGSQFFPGDIPSSNGEQLEARYLQNGNDPSTILLVRPSDGAIVMVFHIIETEASTGDFHVQVVLVNRLDHPDQGQDVLNVEFSTRIPIEYPEYQEQGQVQTSEEDGPYEPEYPEYKDGPDSSVDILDDIPEAHGATYASFLHATSYKDALSCLTAFCGGKITDYVITTDGGHADEDYIFGGNHDKDNANGPDSDPARGDEFGDKFVVGILDINFGADGPSGKVPDPSKPTKSDILYGPKEPALTVDLCVGDTFPGVTSGGHELKVLEKTTTMFGIEVLQVGYCDYDSSSKGKSDDVVVFTLVLQANPNVPLFGAFAFEICGPIDHPLGTTAESTLTLNIPILATDDDGDHPLDDVNITIQVNDDAPMICDVEYISQKGGITWESEVDALTLTGGGGNSGTFTSNEYGSVDEDWLQGGGGNSWLSGGSGNSGAGTVGNHDEDGNGYNNAQQDGDEYGKTFVKGEINVKFGGDGPADDNPFALTVYDTSDPQNLPVFKDADGNTFTSGGHELVVLHSEAGVLEVGYKADPTGDELPDEVPSITIFTLTLNDKGCFDFCLEGPIDHTGQNEQTLPIKFDVVVTDNDGDAETVTLDIRVNDDKPEVGISYVSNLEVDLWSEGGYLSGGGGNGYRETYDYGRVDEDWLQGAVGNGGYAYIGNQDRDGSGASNGNENGDNEGKTRVAGHVNVNYGGDGKSAADAGFGLHSYVVGEVFKDGDGTGNSFTSGGQTLVVLAAGSDLSGTQWVVVGIDRPDVVDVEATENSAVGDQTIFTFAFNKNSGQFEFDLYGPIDHSPVTGDNGTETDQLINFDLGAATDGDGDTANAVVKINVNDDVPVIHTTYYNGLEHDFIPGPNDLIPGAPGTVGITGDYGHVDEDWLKGASGNSLVYTGNQDTDIDNQAGDDFGKSQVSGQISVSFGGDGPGDAGVDFGLAVYTIPPFPAVDPDATAEEFEDLYDAYNATLPVFKNADGSTVSSGGVELQVLESDSGHLLVGIPGYATGNDESVILVPRTVIFELHFNAATGEFDFELFGKIDHEQVAGSNVLESNELLTFKVGSATDGDGDTVDAVIKIQVNDDAPQVGVEYFNNDGYSSTTVGIVDEDHVLSGAGNGDADGAGTGGDTEGKGAVFFDLKAGGFGGDGPGAQGSVSFTAQEGDSINVKDDNGNTQTLTSNGHTVLVHVIQGTTSVLTGYYNSDGSTGFVADDPDDPNDTPSVIVFTLAYNPNSDSGQFNLRQPVDHAISGTEDNLLLTFGIQTGPTDGDGDPAIAWINIQVNDDGPKAVDDSGVYASSGNLLSNDKFGGDGLKSFSVNGTTITETTNFVTGLGTLTVDADGGWEYVPTSGPAPVEMQDIFSYEVVDNDGDVSTASLTITIPGTGLPEVFALVQSGPSGPTHEVADHYDRDVTVNLLGTNGIVFDSKATHFEDSLGGHIISGGGGDDFINVTGNVGSILLAGNGGDDIIQGGGGKDTIKGGAGDDTLYGGGNDDSIFGDAGHDAMSGGDGNDTFQKVDADDLDGTNTLDGTHSIDGGDGYDTVDISGLKTFDSDQAMRLENVEHLAMDGKASGGGTTMTLSYDAAYGITQVGALSHALNITGDASGKGADTVHLVHGAGGETWSQIGSTNVYEAGVGASKVTVTIEAGVHVDMS